MAALLRKELRGLLPFWLLVLVLYAGDLVQIVFAKRPDQLPLARTFLLLEPGAALVTGFVGFLLAFWLAGGLLVAEHDGGHLEFLDALPVTRGRLFAAKVVAAAVVLGSGPALSTLESILLHALSRDSLDSGFHAGLLGRTLLLSWAQSLVWLAFGLSMSFLRELRWLATALVFAGYAVAVDRFPALSILDVLDLLRPTGTAEGIRISWRLLAAQGALTGLGLAASWLLFRRLGRRARQRSGRRRRLVRWAASVAAAGIVAVWVARELPEPGEREGSGHAQFPTWAASRASTRHYAVSYPGDLASRARSLASRADAVHDRVAEFFGAAPVGEIAVDAGARASGRVVGTAAGRTIRLDLRGEEDIDVLVARLAHETAHVYANALSGRRLGEAARWTRFFDEGLASYVEHRFFRPSAAVEPLRSSAALVHARGALRFEQWMDDAALRARQDPELAYALGESFVTALVGRFGDDAPARVLRAFGREPAPRGLEGMDLWRDVFNAAGLELETALEELRTRLEAEAERRRAWIESLPRLYGALAEGEGEEDEEWVGLRVFSDRPIADGPAEIDVVCRFRADADADEEDFEQMEPDEGEICWADRSLYPRGAFEFQIGLRQGPEGPTVYEEWSELRFAE